MVIQIKVTSFILFLALKKKKKQFQFLKNNVNSLLAFEGWF